MRQLLTSSRSVGAAEIQALFVDSSRCIGCRACEEACSECPSHAGVPMIHLDFVDRSTTVQTAPTVCMHCDDPACARVCPADAIKIDEQGIVHTAMAERCIGCGNCALACPFGVPKIDLEKQLMMKCDLCYDRTALGMKPMCATVCPSGALFYGSAAEVEDLRQARPLHRFTFGEQVVETRNALMAPAAATEFVVRAPGPRVRPPAELHLEEAIW